MKTGVLQYSTLVFIFVVVEINTLCIVELNVFFPLVDVTDRCLDLHCILTGRKCKWQICKYHWNRT